MQYVFFLLASIVACATAYTTARPVARSMRLYAKSKALPFLEAPPKLDGSMIGDVGE